MTTNEWKNLKRLYHLALERPPAEREAFISKVSGADAAQRDELRALLAEERDDDFLQPPMSGAAWLGAEDAQKFVGHTVGSYQIDRLLGTGGMGNVYLASRADGDFRQQVAVKVIKRGMDTDVVLRQFRRERQALALLNHPNIARLYDGGATDDGRPYLVMEFIDGEPIDAYCERRGLAIRDRLNLFADVCDGVEFAHRHLVVHRDLKPANILVTPDGVPKLLDFGIAKVLNDAEGLETTQAADRRLTPEYASPEQVSGGPISTATDIYSLGVILYELLTDRRPYQFGTRSPQTIETTIRFHQPIAPSVAVTRAKTDARTSPKSREAATGSNAHSDAAPAHLVRMLRGDLDTIVLTALQKEPSRRYPSVESLSGDIHRFQTGMPIAARKDTLTYRLQKFVLRHRMGSTAAGVILMLLLFGSGAIIRYARIADRERDAAGVARVHAEEAAHAASQERDAAYVARDEAEAIAGFFRDSLSAADPAIAGPNITVRSLLDEAVNQIATSLADRPMVQAAVRSTIGRTYSVLGLYDKAEPQLTAAYDQRVALLGNDHHDVAESRTDLASLRYAQGRFEEAEILLKQSLAAHEQLRGPLNVDTARVLNDLGAVFRAEGKLDEAEQMHERALAAYEKAEGRESLSVAMSLNNLGAVYRGRKDFAATEKVLTESLAIRRKRLPLSHPMVIQSMHNLALTQVALGRLTEAEQMLREAVTQGEKTMGADHPDQAIIVKSLSGVLMRENKFEDALPFARKAEAVFNARYPADHPRRLAAHADLAHCLVKLSKFDEAEPLLLAMMADRPVEMPRSGPWADAALDLIELYDRTGRPDQAATWRERCKQPAATSSSSTSK